VEIKVKQSKGNILDSNSPLIFLSASFAIDTKMRNASLGNFHGRGILDPVRVHSLACWFQLLIKFEQILILF